MILKFTLFLLLSYEVLQRLLLHPDESTWKVFLSQNAKIIFHSISQFSSDRDERMDLFVFVCESLARNNFDRLRKFHERKKGKKAKFSTWLILVVRNLCIDWYRSREGRFRIFKAIDNLGDLDKRIFDLIYLRGFSVQECYEIIRQSKTDRPDAVQFCESLQRIHQSLTRKNREKLLNLLVKKRDRLKFALRSGKQTCIDYLPEKETLLPDVQLQKKLILRIIRQLLAELPDEDKLLLKYWFETDLTGKRIAELLGWEKADKVYARVNTIVRRLRSRLKEKNINYDDVENLDDLNFLF